MLFLSDLCGRQFGLKFGTIITFRANEMENFELKNLKSSFIMVIANCNNANG